MNGAAATSLSPVFAGAALAERGSLVVSLHDVAPATRGASEEMAAQLRRRGVDAASFLVVPDYHHRGCSLEDAGFTRWLKDLQSDGHEMVLHGYFHERPAAGSENWRERAVTQIYTAGEGEFYDLPYEEARARIGRGCAQFKAAGLRAHGFIAPAWLLGAEAERAATDAGMEYTTRLRTVRDLRSGRDYAARSLVYSVRNLWRRKVSLGWNRTLLYLTRSSPLVRLSLHPPDLEHSAVWQQILTFVAELTSTRRVTTYRDWIAEQRAGDAQT